MASETTSHRSGSQRSTSRRYSVILLIAGLAGGIPIGWHFGSRSKVEEIQLPPAKTTNYTTFSNEELKNKAAQQVAVIRALVRSYNEEDAELRRSANENSGKAAAQSERDRIRQTWIADSDKLHGKFIDRYKSDLWADALLLREAIAARVGGAPGAQSVILFQHPTNMLGVEQVANALDLLGESLPAKSE